MRTIVTAALQRQYLQTELILWTANKTEKLILIPAATEC
jgi:hypothetical protein